MIWAAEGKGWVFPKGLFRLRQSCKLDIVALSLVPLDGLGITMKKEHLLAIDVQAGSIFSGPELRRGIFTFVKDTWGEHYEPGNV